MTFGITSASEVLQKWTYKTFDDIPNVHIVADDMLIAAKTEAGFATEMGFEIVTSSPR